jgi:hypothetical protein
MIFYHASFIPAGSVFYCCFFSSFAGLCRQFCFCVSTVFYITLFVSYICIVLCSFNIPYVLERLLIKSLLLLLKKKLGFNSGRLHFNYLGCPIFVGKSKVIHFKSIAGKIKIKHAAWKGSLLSIMGRVQLVKTIMGEKSFAHIGFLDSKIYLERRCEYITRKFVW